MPLDWTPQPSWTPSCPPWDPSIRNQSASPLRLLILFCRSVLEQSCVLWGTSLTQENIEDLERTQKTFSILVLIEKFKDYKNVLIIFNLDSLQNRREQLNLKFAKTGIENEKLNDFISNE